MGADNSAENTPNDPDIICQICLPKTKILDFFEKSLYWLSVVSAYEIDI